MSTYYYNDSENQMNSKLVLCIEEYDNKIDTNSIDTRLFITWSYEEDAYIVRGKRQDIGPRAFVPYAFHCESTDELYDFIKFTVGSRSNKSITLYNYNNINFSYYELKDDELTYEFFEENMDKNYEISGYDNSKLKRKYVKKYLRMLRNMYNLDNFDNNYY